MCRAPGPHGPPLPPNGNTPPEIGDGKWVDIKGAHPPPHQPTPTCWLTLTPPPTHPSLSPLLAYTYPPGGSFSMGGGREGWVGGGGK